jgi:hypothetical protein
MKKSNEDKSKETERKIYKIISVVLNSTVRWDKRFFTNTQVLFTADFKNNIYNRKKGSNRTA